MAELGYPGFDAITWYGVFVPAGTPAAVITRLHGEFNPVLSSADFKRCQFNQGSESVPSSPEELHAQVKRELVLYAPIIKKSGMKAD